MGETAGVLDVDTDALTYPLHLAITRGPGVGRSLGVRTRAVTLGRDRSLGAHVLPDPLLSRQHVQVRVGRHRDAPVLQARDCGSTNGSSTSRHRPRRADGTPRWRRRRRLRSPWRRLRPGDLLHLGATTLEVREHPGARDQLPPPAPADQARTRSSRTLDAAMRILPAAAMLGMMVPLLMMRGSTPWRWLLLLMPVLLIVVGVMTLLNSQRTPASRPTDPARLLLDLARGVRAPSSAPPVSEPRAPSLPWHLPDAPVRYLQPGQSLGVAGPHAAAVARWLAVRMWAACPPGTCELVNLSGDATMDLPSTGTVTSTGTSTGTATSTGTSTGTATSTEHPRWRIVVRAGQGRPAGPGGAAAGAENAQAHTVTLVLSRHRSTLPSWCTAVIDNADPRTLPDPAWALAAVTQNESSASVPPAQSPLLAQVLDPHLSQALCHGELRGAAAVRRSWMSAQREPARVRVPLGVHRDDHTRLIEVDICRDGPHALVAGTTGSGKSEALVTWVLGLALRHSPEHLQLLLIDHKGGATFGPLQGLPHVAGMLTDLDGTATDRAVRSLTAEVARRERLLAEAGVRDIAELEARALPRPPRLIVLADEFRVLADEHPALMDGLRRIAAQGRTLGIHLILATQRPAGAISADLRANVPLRLCLRVLDAADSTDVLGSPAAAHLPLSPGAGYLHQGALTPLQVAWAGPDGALTKAVITATSRAWQSLGTPAPPRPWAAPLPGHVDAEALAQFPAEIRDPGTLTVGVADVPDQQRLGAADLPLRGGVLVLGESGSGRSTTARMVLHAALSRGWHTWVVCADLVHEEHLPAPEIRQGTWVSARDSRRARRLLHLLLNTPVATTAAPGRLLVIEDAEAVADALDVGQHPGSGLELLDRVVRDASRLGVCVVITGAATLASARWVAPLRTRLVHGVREETAGIIGVPPALRGSPRTPGRAVMLHAAGATVIQVGFAPPSEHHGEGSAIPAVPHLRPVSGHVEAVTVAPLPQQVRTDDLLRHARATDAPWVSAGLGGDDGGPVLSPLDAARPWAIVGPPGSGRTTTIEAIEAWLRAQGRPVVRVDSGLTAQRGPLAVPQAGTVLLLDDADTASVMLVEDLMRTPGCPADVGVVLTAAEHQLGAHATGLLGRCTASGTTVVLRPSLSSVREARAGADPTRRQHAVVLYRGQADALIVPQRSRRTSLR